DYLAENNNGPARTGDGLHVGDGPSAIPNLTNINTQELTKQSIRDIILPILEKEVNEGETFATLRQIYSAMIMATWFKKTLTQSLLTQAYVDKSRVAGIAVDDPQAKEKIYQQYIEAYKVGVFNYIKDEKDPVTQDAVPRKYFSGGIQAPEDFSQATSAQARSEFGPRIGRMDAVLTSLQSDHAESGLRAGQGTIIENEVATPVFNSMTRVERDLKVALTQGRGQLTDEALVKAAERQIFDVLGLIEGALARKDKMTREENERLRSKKTDLLERVRDLYALVSPALASDVRDRLAEQFNRAAGPRSKGIDGHRTPDVERRMFLEIKDAREALSEAVNVLRGSGSEEAFSKFAAAYQQLRGMAEKGEIVVPEVKPSLGNAQILLTHVDDWAVDVLKRTFERVQIILAAAQKNIDETEQRVEERKALETRVRGGENLVEAQAVLSKDLTRLKNAKTELYIKLGHELVPLALYSSPGEPALTEIILKAGKLWQAGAVKTPYELTPHLSAERLEAGLPNGTHWDIERFAFLAQPVLELGKVTAAAEADVNDESRIRLMRRTLADVMIAARCVNVDLSPDAFRGDLLAKGREVYAELVQWGARTLPLIPDEVRAIAAVINAMKVPREEGSEKNRVMRLRKRAWEELRLILKVIAPDVRNITDPDAVNLAVFMPEGAEKIVDRMREAFNGQIKNGPARGIDGDPLKGKMLKNFSEKERARPDVWDEVLTTLELRLADVMRKQDEMRRQRYELGDERMYASLSHQVRRDVDIIKTELQQLAALITPVFTVQYGRMEQVSDGLNAVEGKARELFKQEPKAGNPILGKGASALVFESPTLYPRDLKVLENILDGTLKDLEKAEARYQRFIQEADKIKRKREFIEFWRDIDRVKKDIPLLVVYVPMHLGAEDKDLLDEIIARIEKMTGKYRMITSAYTFTEHLTAAKWGEDAPHIWNLERTALLAGPVMALQQALQAKDLVLIQKAFADVMTWAKLLNIGLSEATAQGALELRAQVLINEVNGWARAVMAQAGDEIGFIRQMLAGRIAARDWRKDRSKFQRSWDELEKVVEALDVYVRWIMPLDADKTLALMRDELKNVPWNADSFTWADFMKLTPEELSSVDQQKRGFALVQEALQGLDAVNARIVDVRQNPPATLSASQLKDVRKALYRKAEDALRQIQEQIRVLEAMGDGTHGAFKDDLEQLRQGLEAAKQVYADLRQVRSAAVSKDTKAPKVKVPKIKVPATRENKVRPARIIVRKKMETPSDMRFVEYPRLVELYQGLDEALKKLLAVDKENDEYGSFLGPMSMAYTRLKSEVDEMEGLRKPVMVLGHNIDVYRHISLQASDLLAQVSYFLEGGMVDVTGREVKKKVRTSGISRPVTRRKEKTATEAVSARAKRGQKNGADEMARVTVRGGRQAQSLVEQKVLSADEIAAMVEQFSQTSGIKELPMGLSGKVPVVDVAVEKGRRGPKVLSAEEKRANLQEKLGALEGRISGENARDRKEIESIVGDYQKLAFAVSQQAADSLERQRYAQIKLEIQRQVSALPENDPLRKIIKPLRLTPQERKDAISRNLDVLDARLLSGAVVTKKDLEQIEAEHKRIGVQISTLLKEIPVDDVRSQHRSVASHLKEAVELLVREDLPDGDPVTLMLGQSDVGRFQEEMRLRFAQAWSASFMEMSWHGDDVKKLVPVLEQKFSALLSLAREAGAFNNDPDLLKINGFVAAIGEYVVLLKQHGYYAQDEREIDSVLLDEQLALWETAGWINGRNSYFLQHNPDAALEQVRGLIKSSLLVAHGELVRQLDLVTDKASVTDLGGIDLNGDRLGIKVKVDGDGMPLSVQFQDPGLMNIQGLTPIIREIIPNAAAVIPLLGELVN
ncbi:MAG: hypothetical protein HQL17_05240, partial [Candidatus Omnitrophica bacterium]|nr:hypothetical protein [Candidatus Omnitrophota bacterium]